MFMVLAKVNGEGCLQSIPTVTVVGNCPRNITEWIKSKSQKQCHLVIQNCTSTKTLDYHCLSDKFQENVYEVCAPRKQIVGGHCPFYDREKNIIEPNFYQSCKEHTSPCPNLYHSDMAFKYHECYGNVKKNKTNDNNNKDLTCSVTVPDFDLGKAVWNIILIGACVSAIVYANYFLIRMYKRRCYTWGCINEEHNTRRAAEYDGGLESSDLAHYEEKACSEKRPKVTRSKRKN